MYLIKTGCFFEVRLTVSAMSSWENKQLLIAIVVSFLFFAQSFGLEIRLSNSKYFSFIRLNAKAPAEALKTE